MLNTIKRHGFKVAGAVAVVGLLSVGGAQAVDGERSNTVGSAIIKDGSIKQRDVAPNFLALIKRGAQDGRDGVDGQDGRDGIDGEDGEDGAPGAPGAPGKDGKDGKDGVSGLESDGPYPGSTELQEGDNSTTAWANDGTLQRAWVQCPTGKAAIGGGFSRHEGSAATAYQQVDIVTSQPAQFANGAEVYQPIAGDVDGSFVPNAWLIEGFNNSGQTLIVRPHVVCAAIN
jgi:hypothetical protein